MNPDSIQLQIIKRYKVTIFEYNILQSMVSLPNIVFCIFAGFFLDFAGLSTGGLIFTLLTSAGLILFAVSGVERNFELALIGRAIYGIGCEC